MYTVGAGAFADLYLKGKDGDRVPANCSASKYSRVAITLTLNSASSFGLHLQQVPCSLSIHADGAKLLCVGTLAVSFLLQGRYVQRK